MRIDITLPSRGIAMETRHLSLTEAAEAFDISKSYLSEAVRAQKAAKGHDLHRYAVMEGGQIDGFEIPVSMLPHGGAMGDGHGQGDGKGSSSQRTNERTANERTKEGERENPSGESVAASVAAGMAAKEAVDLVKSLRSPLEDADPTEAAEYMGTVVGVLMDAAPILAGAAWAYTHQDSDDVSQISGALLAAAGVDVLVHGVESQFVQAFRGEETEETSTSMEGSAPTADDVAREVMGGDGAATVPSPGDVGLG
jgi:hypothetical protein